MGRSGGTLILALLAIAGIGAFFYWLDQESAALDTVVAPVMEEEAPEAVDLNTAAMAADLQASIGQQGWLRFVRVDQRLGRAAFSIGLDAENSLPVLLSPDLIRRGTEVYANDQVNLHGKMFVLNDSIKGEWVSQEAVDAGNEGSIPDTPGFFLADSLSMN